jgi:EAL domain-containing protein (putative c-di-GMP-specific phosphodiesterase class I)/GGDEF domain-containing protein
VAPSSRTLLGFAFAAGDLLLEVDRSGRIFEAIGAGQALVGVAEAALVGETCLDLFAPNDTALLEAVFTCMDEGQRRGPFPVRLSRPGSYGASVNLRALPGNGGRISLAMTAAPVPENRAGEDGLYDRESFEGMARGLTEAAKVAGRELELAMIELQGLETARQAMAPAEAEAFDTQVGGALRAESGSFGAAARLEGDRFAILREGGEPAAAVARRVTQALSAACSELDLTATAQSVPIEAANPTRLGRALRFALDDFIAEGLKECPPRSMAEAMNRSVQRTLTRAGALGAAVSQRRFALAYQPVVRVADGTLHHHEALIRFEENTSPFAMVRMAEEFDLIEELDRAVVEQVVRRLKADRTGKLRLAANISGRSIGSSPFIEGLQRLIGKTRDLAPRLIFEITESAAIDDLPLANKHIQALRTAGSLVCLDDFGSGAASMAYLQALTVDVVKIDGRYVRDLATGGRDAALVRHMVKLCKDLNVRTVAEMVETAEVEEAIAAAGVDLAQGWRYGRPAETPEEPMKSAPVVARRRTGTTDDWR